MGEIKLITRKDKRGLQKDTNYFFEFIKIKEHFFKVSAGRSRWKIENEGFNNQKNNIYDIQHANSLNYNAMKNHYLLTQIADIVMQLYMAGQKMFKTVKKTLKEISLDLLEAIRTRRLTDKDILQLANPIQVRFT
mgnify:CR=1 FL=1